MDLLAFIQVADPTKVKVGEQERAEEEARILDSTVGRVVLLLPVALTRDDSELEASVDRLFDQGGSADQGDSAASGGQETETKIVTGVRFITDENVVTEKPNHPRKKRQAVTDASGSSHPPKKLRGDHKTSSEPATGDKSSSVLKELLASSMLNVEVGVATVATLPMITSSVSATPEHESGAPTDCITGLNLRTQSPYYWYDAVPLVMTEAVITTNVASIPSAPAPETGTKVISPVHASMFHDSDSTGTWNVSNDSLLDDHDVSWEFINHLAPPVLFAQICEMDYHHLFTEFNVRTARQVCLNAEVRIRTKYCLSERRRLESECEKQADLLKARDAEEFFRGSAEDSCPSVSAKDLELKDLNAAVSSLRSQKDGLVDQVLCVTPPKSSQGSGIPLGVRVHHSSTNTAEAGVDSFVRSVVPPPVMTETVITTNVASIPSAPASKTSTKVISLVHASMFHDSDSTGTVRPNAIGSSHITMKELLMGSRDINSETLHDVFVPQ
ncbi:hypothetical protein Tco_0649067 [Tanacetum coccineum]